MGGQRHIHDSIKADLTYSHAWPKNTKAPDCTPNDIAKPTRKRFKKLAPGRALVVLNPCERTRDPGAEHERVVSDESGRKSDRKRCRLRLRVVPVWNAARHAETQVLEEVTPEREPRETRRLVSRGNPGSALKIK